MDPEKLATILNSLGEAADAEARDAILSELSADQLAEVKTALSETARTLAQSVKSGESEDPKADLEAAKAAKAVVASVEKRQGEIQAEADSQSADADSVLEGLEADDPATDEPTAPVEAADPDPAEPVVETEPVIEEPVPVAASAAPRPVPLGEIAKHRRPQPEPEPTNPGAVLVASGKMDDIRAGHVFADSRELGAAMAAAGHALSGGGKVKVATGNFRDSVPYRASSDGFENWALFDRIRREAEAGEVITASGGLCAPATPIYEFFSVSSRSDLLSLPTIQSERGSIEFPVSPGVAQLLGQSGIAQEWTNANDQNPSDPATKPVFTPGCVTTSTCEIAGWATRLSFGEFQQLFYPEFVAHLTSESMIAHDHTVDAALLTDMAALATMNVPLGADDATGGGAWVNLTSTLTWYAAYYRNKHRMGRDATLEVLLPAYFRDALAADYIARNGSVDFTRAYAAVDAWFTQANLRVQWLANLSALSTPGTWYPPGDAFIYAPGTVVRQTRGTLDLGVIRDSTTVATNDFQTFIETFDSVCLVGNELMSLTDIVICPDGVTGEQAAIVCPTGTSS